MNRWHRLLLERLREARSATEAEVLAGRIATMEAYKFHVGFLEALRRVEDMMDEIEEVIAKGN